MNGPQANWLPDGRRLHLNHGPIDLIVEAFGEAEEVRQAYRQAVERFQTILDELVERADRTAQAGFARWWSAMFRGSTARRMEAAVLPFATDFITPMAAVAGSVADEIMAAMKVGRRLDKAYVNNGGDIALHIAPGHSLTLAIGGTGHGFADRIVLDLAIPSPWHRNERLARPQFFAGHCRRGDRAGTHARPKQMRPPPSSPMR